MNPRPDSRSLFGQWRLNIDYRRDLRTNPDYAPNSRIYQAQSGAFQCQCGANHLSKQADWSGVTRPIVFTYRQGTEKLGNVLLRGFQVADLLIQMGAPVSVTVQPMENLYRAKPHNHIIVVLKSAVREKSEPVLKALRRWRNYVLFDVVDGLVPERLADIPHAYVCASLTEQIARKRSGHSTILSLQSPDQRTPSFDFTRRKGSIAYYGLPENAKHLQSLPMVDVVEYQEMPAHRSSARLPAVFDQLKTYSHHYTVRAWNDRDGFKPMMKGFFAGLLGSVVIASAEDEESRLTLGEDYPYLADSSGLTDVRKVITLALETHHGETWLRAVGTMKHLRQISCPLATAGELIKGLAAVSD